ncbi:MAG: TetR/AcrR family transcriptional regulator [Spirochaetota bacterium]
MGWRVQLTDRQQQIVETAIDIIARRGIQELTIKNLSGRIGISEPALYRHFENKHAILVGILDSFAEWSTNTLADIASSDLSPADKIREVFHRHTVRFVESPATSGVLFAEEIFKNEPVLAQRVMQIMRVAQESVHRILEEGIEAGVFRRDVPLEHLAVSSLGSLRLLVTRWRLRNYDFDLHEQGTRLADSVVKLLSA